ncbi:MAG TPA: methyltransferase domain-containing protein [Bacillota bacterium]
MNSQFNSEVNDILSLEEASQLFQVSTKTFLKLLREENIPARKIGREWRFSRTALLAWLAAGNSQDYISAEEAGKAYFAEVAPVYDELRKGCYGEALRELLLSRFPPRFEYEVADIGTGTGYLAKSLAGYAHKVWAVDSSPAMLEVARRELQQAGLTNVEFLQGDALDLPLPDCSQHMVFANLLLHHVLEPSMAVKEMYRILKAGGQIIITDVDRHYHSWTQTEKSDIYLGFERQEIKKWLAEAGFTKISITNLGCNCRTSNRAGNIVQIPMFQAVAFKPDDEKNQKR